MSKSMVILIFFWMHNNNLNLFQEIEGPAPDIWVWGLEPGLGYLPHVRRRPRLFWNRFEHSLALFFYQIEYYIEEIAAEWFWYMWKELFLFFSFHFYFPFCPFRKIVRKLRSMQESRLFPGFETVRLLLNGRDAESRQTLLQNCP